MSEVGEHPMVPAVGRKLDVDLLVGSNEIAQRVGFRHPQTVHHYKNNDPTFPKPVLILGGDQRSTHIWYWPDVERWGRRTGRLPKPARPKSGGQDRAGDPG